jgi:hypothetical protein
VHTLCRRTPLALLLAVLTNCAPEPDFTLRIADVGPFEPLTPSLEKSETLLVKDLVYEPLLIPGDNGELASRLASSCTRIPGGRIYVELDASRRFSDGSPVTLQDVADSLTAAGLLTAPRDSGLEIAPGVDGVWPELVLPRAPIFKKAASGHLGTGAFVVVSQSNDRIVLQRSIRARHRVARVELLAYPTEGEALMAAKKGECNGYLGARPRPAEFATYVSQLQAVPIPPIHHLAIIFNHKLLSSMERQVLLPHVQASHLENIEPESLGSYTTNTVKLGLGSRFTVVTWNADRTSHRMALAVRRMLGSRGGEVVEFSPAEAATAVAEGRFEIVIGPFRTWPEAESLSFWRGGGPLAAAGYSNPALDAALAAGDWQAARQAFDRDPPGIFTMEWQTMALLDPRIVNPTFGRYLRLETLPSWEVR